MTERIALFIDGVNLHYTTRALAFEVDFKKLLQHFGEFGTIVRAFFYTNLKENDEPHSIRPLLDWLDYNGFAVRAKVLRDYDDGEGRRRTKRNISVELAIDALEMTPYLDHIFLFSGDGDLRRLVESVQRRGVGVTVVSSLRAGSLVSDDLRRQANRFIEIDTLKESIERLASHVARV